jgi:hypothetical protein
MRNFAIVAALALSLAACETESVDTDNDTVGDTVGDGTELPNDTTVTGVDALDVVEDVVPGDVIADFTEDVDLDVAPDAVEEVSPEDIAADLPDDATEDVALPEDATQAE